MHSEQNLSPHFNIFGFFISSKQIAQTSVSSVFDGSFLRVLTTAGPCINRVILITRQLPIKHFVPMKHIKISCQ